MKNKEELQSLIRKLGNEAVHMLDEEWEKVVIGYFIDCDQISHCQVYCLFSGEEDYTDLLECSWDNTQYDEPIMMIREYCKKVYELCKTAGDDWHAMSFVLNGDLSYNADYSYDVIENYDSRFIMNWQSEYLD